MIWAICAPDLTVGICRQRGHALMPELALEVRCKKIVGSCLVLLTPRNPQSGLLV
jgi:hypothetical protein